MVSEATAVVECQFVAEENGAVEMVEAPFILALHLLQRLVCAHVHVCDPVLFSVVLLPASVTIPKSLLAKKLPESVLNYIKSNLPLTTVLRSGLVLFLSCKIKP